MTSTEVKTVFGRPVTGEIPTRSRSHVEQKPIDGFIDWLDSVLELDGVEAVKWQQHTPSWNDGDVCEFGVGEFHVRVEGDPEDCGDCEDGFRDAYGFREDHPEIEAALKKMTYSDERAYEHALEQAFGDPAEITATKDGFAVEYYDAY